MLLGCYGVVCGCGIATCVGEFTPFRRDGGGLYTDSVAATEQLPKVWQEDDETKTPYPTTLIDPKITHITPRICSLSDKNAIGIYTTAPRK